MRSGPKPPEPSVPPTPEAGLAASSSRIRDLRRLVGGRRARHEAGWYVVEGPVLVREALEADVEVGDVYVGSDAEATYPWLGQLASDVACWRVKPGVLERVLDTTTPQPVAATVRLPASGFERLTTAAGSPLVVVLDGLADPGNVGTLIRGAEAFGAAGVVVTGHGVDPHHPKTVRASAGSILRVPVVEGEATSALDHLRREGLAWVATSRAADDRPEDLDLTGPVALVLGNEAHGLESSIVERADRVVAIPMQGRVESLNVAMAGTVLLAEAARQRRAGAKRMGA